MIDTNNLKVDKGKYKGELWTRVPAQYLQWLVKSNNESAHIADAELNRRGITEKKDLFISTHAIDRASQHLLRHFQLRQDKELGFYNWLYNEARFAMKANPGETRVKHRGVYFIFNHEDKIPTLITIYVSNT